MMHWGGYGWTMGFGFGWMAMIPFWTIVVFGVIYAVRGLSGKGASSEKEDTALEILEKRYAKGEINKEEFKEKRRSIE